MPLDRLLVMGLWSHDFAGSKAASCAAERRESGSDLGLTGANACIVPEPRAQPTRGQRVLVSREDYVLQRTCRGSVAREPTGTRALPRCPAPPPWRLGPDGP